MKVIALLVVLGALLSVSGKTESRTKRDITAGGVIGALACLPKVITAASTCESELEER